MEVVASVANRMQHERNATDIADRAYTMHSDGRLKTKFH